MNRISTAIFSLLLCFKSVFAQTLYTTDFEEFAVGENALVVENSGWDFGSSLTTGSHGIDDEIVSGLGKSAYLGFNQPDSRTTTVVKIHNYDPVADEQPVIQFESLLGVEDSDNGQRDTFAVVFLNAMGDLLASIQFRNNDSVFGIWYSDGVTVRDTGLDFIRGELQLLTLQINFESNQWSAQFDGLELFSDINFHSGGKALNLGSTGAQWIVTSLDVTRFGNNFLLLADWNVQSVPVDDFQVTAIQRVAKTNEISFSAEAGFTYRVDSTSVLGGTWEVGERMETDEVGIMTMSSDSDGHASFFRVVREFSRP